ncbi:hypothetical protein ONE63_002692 [Megalurothrips usitatus]|uniref:Peptidase S1 domain-containing protein n=1 Tax=Megalurothrips usitatus TaxID=439358 RepID=A0AAV7XF44_9NEOP|nr:hypothetical protein ONE63_002692 [Megalurothrips usitatus]
MAPPYPLIFAAMALVTLAPPELLAAASPLDVKPMIIGGDTALPGQFPYQVSVRRLSWFPWAAWRHRCAGTLVSNDWVLTTATCTQGVWFLRVAAGKVDLKHTEDGEQELAVSKTVVHPDFKRATKSSWQSDVALLRTNTPFQYSANVRPARLPLAEFDTSSGGALLVTGWGVSENGGWFGWGRHTADVLQVTVVQTTACPSAGDAGSGGLCVLPDSAATPCEGDEGGAMVQMLGDYTFTVVGMVTRAPVHCKSPREPSAAVAVFRLMSFIQDTMTAP